MGLLTYEANLRFPVSLAAKARYISSAAQDIDITAARLVLIAYCKITSPDDDDIKYFLERVFEPEKILDNDMPKPAESKKKATDSSTKKKGSAFQQKYIDFLDTRDIEALLLLMSEYDYNKARNWYCERDKDVTRTALAVFLRDTLERHTVLLEASLFGFGGSYEDEEQTLSNTGRRVVSADSPEGEAMMRSWGMIH
jgi:hypothetical protein